MQSQSAISTIISSQQTDSLFDQKGAGEYLGGISPDTLSVWRCTGRYNLPFVKIGRLVRYRKSDLDKFLASRTHGEVAQ